jgi:GNAT superfamily N-acetyltransferase
LAAEDLDSRRDLTPWLAGVFVLPEYRRRGHASALVRHVEGVAREGGFGTLWLYTSSAAGLYARLGWAMAGFEREWQRGVEVALMRRDLTETR